MWNHTFAAAYPDVIGPTVATRYNDLDAAGIKGNLLVGAEQSHGTTLAQRLDWIKTNVPDFTIGIEGSNESSEHDGDTRHAVRHLPAREGRPGALLQARARPERRFPVLAEHVA
ncbi:MAG: hypothetical protein H0W96_02050 [Solirubrobacterales bacterium]|nr:hypothetical protein [Solirubrobacterales bacterium]